MNLNKGVIIADNENIVANSDEISPEGSVKIRDENNLKKNMVGKEEKSQRFYNILNSKKDSKGSEYSGDNSAEENRISRAPFFESDSLNKSYVKRDVNNGGDEKVTAENQFASEFKYQNCSVESLKIEQNDKNYNHGFKNIEQGGLNYNHAFMPDEKITTDIAYSSAPSNSQTDRPIVKETIFTHVNNIRDYSASVISVKKNIDTDNVLVNKASGIIPSDESDVKNGAFINTPEASIVVDNIENKEETKLITLDLKSENIDIKEGVGHINEDEKTNKSIIKEDASVVSNVLAETQQFVPSDINIFEVSNVQSAAQLKELVTQVVSYISTMHQQGVNITTVQINQPPIFNGATIIIKEHDTAKGEFNIDFTNLSSEAFMLIENLGNQAALRQAMEHSGYVLHMISSSEQSFINIGEPSESLARDHHEGNSDGRQQRDDRHEDKDG